MRIEQLTFTRFIAAILIVVFHYGNESPLFNNSYVNFIISQANVGVSYFFLLSGFVMMIAYVNQDKIDWSKYLKNRFARIYPIYFGALILVFLANILANKINLEGFILNLLMIQAWIPEKALVFNLPAWSLSVELFFYISFPFIYNNYIKHNSLKKVIIGVLLIWIISQIIFHLLLICNPLSDFIINENSFYKYFPLLHLNEFLIGIGTGYFFTQKLTNTSRNTDMYLIVILFFLVLILKYNTFFNLHNGALALLFSLFVILLSINNGILTQLFKKPFFVFLGEISYGIYILQFPVFSIFSYGRIVKYLKITDYTLIFFVRIFILIILSALAYKFFEIPMRNKLKNIDFYFNKR